MKNQDQPAGQGRYRHLLADRLLDWAKASEDVLAWFWYGSYSLQKWSRGADLDAAVLVRPGCSLDLVREKICAVLGAESGMNLRRADPSRVICFVGNEHLKVECVIADDPEQLLWLADSDDVPPPRLVLAFERNDAGRNLAARAARPCMVDTTAVVNREIEKFIEAFEACSRAHHRSDAYSFYFQYNLALGRLARLVQIARYGPERLYLPPQLTNTRLRPEERQGFIDLAGSLYLPKANGQKRKLMTKFLEFAEELSRTYAVEHGTAELRGFLEAIWQRDYFWNVRDWAEHLHGRARSGVVVRASTLTRWQGEPELQRWLGAQKVKQIIDLRSDRPSDGAAYLAETTAGIEYIRLPLMQDGAMDPDDRSAHYFGIAMNNLPLIAEALRKLADASGCSVIHCYAGIDRTGVIMAMIGEVLGVPRDMLVEDYVASGAELQRHSMARFLDAIAAQGGSEQLLRKAGLNDSTVKKLRKRIMGEVGNESR